MKKKSFGSLAYKNDSTESFKINHIEFDGYIEKISLSYSQ